MSSFGNLGACGDYIPNLMEDPTRLADDDIEAQKRLMLKKEKKKRGPFYALTKRLPFKKSKYGEPSAWEELIANEISVVKQENGIIIAQLPVCEEKMPPEDFARRCCIGFEMKDSLLRENASIACKTLLFIGESGVGKTTMTDGAINYLLCVAFEDNYRFRLVDPVRDSGRQAKNNWESQTERITAYTLPYFHNVSKHAFQVKIIDTPGFNDSRGPKRDEKLKRHFYDFLHNPGKYGVSTVDAVCLVMKHSTTTLTASQQWVLSCVTSVFGKDLADNFFLMVTHAQDSEPPVAKALRDYGKISFSQMFVFDNGSLFSGPKAAFLKGKFGSSKRSSDIMHAEFDMGQKSFEDFFKYLETHVKPASLVLTKQVMDKRDLLQRTSESCDFRYDKLMGKMQSLELEKNLLRVNAEREDRVIMNQKCEVERPVIYLHKHDGFTAVVCDMCQENCHSNCVCNTARGIKDCLIFAGTDSCKICKNKCPVDKHRKADSLYKLKTVKESTCLPRMQENVENAKSPKDQCIAKITQIQVEIEREKVQLAHCFQDIARISNEFASICLFEQQPRKTVQEYFKDKYDYEAQEEDANKRQLRLTVLDMVKAELQA